MFDWIFFVGGCPPKTPHQVSLDGYSIVFMLYQYYHVLYANVKFEMRV